MARNRTPRMRPLLGWATAGPARGVRFLTGVSVEGWPGAEEAAGDVAADAGSGESVALEQRCEEEFCERRSERCHEVMELVRWVWVR